MEAGAPTSLQGRLCLQGPHTGSLPSVREGIVMLWTLAQAAKQAEAGQGRGRPDGARTHRGTGKQSEGGRGLPRGHETK